MNRTLRALLKKLAADSIREEVVSAKPRFNVVYNPSGFQAEYEQFLIGVGRWGNVDHPIHHTGVCLNNKGLAQRYGLPQDPSTVTDLVLNPPPELEAQWRQFWGSGETLETRLSRITIVVEDAAPDAIFAFLLWLCRVEGVYSNELHQSYWSKWIEAVRRWELTGLVNDPFTSWAALLSALSHSYFGPYAATNSGEFDFSSAWREALQFTATLLLRNVDPDAVPELWDITGYRRATALLRSEQQDYLNSLPSSICLQLLVPIAGQPKKEMLIDAYLTSETWPSGARKLFARLDQEHTFTRQGFALMAIHRPDPRIVGTGDDIVISVNSSAGIQLQELWYELERMETDHWQGERPTENPRPIVSYAHSEGYTQPWWDDNGHYTLLGAPRRLPDGRLGSRLSWQDVVNAIWRIYSPTRHLQVIDALNAGESVKPEQCRRINYRYDGGDKALHKYFMAMRWSYDTHESGALLEAPTVQRFFAALLARRNEAQTIDVDSLPGSESYALIHLYGGFAIISDSGALVFDDWRMEPLRQDKLQTEFERLFDLLKMKREIENKLDAIVNERAATDQTRSQRTMLGELTTLRSQLVDAGCLDQSHSHWPDVKAFRKVLEEQWALQDALSHLHERVSQVENAIRTESSLDTERLAYLLSTIGLPFYLSGTLTQYIQDWLFSLFPSIAKPWVLISCYLSLAFIFIFIVHSLMQRWLRFTRIRKYLK